MLISLHGEAYGCCGPENNRNLSTSLGNIEDCSVYDIWHGEKFALLREKCATPGGYKEVALCKRCVLPRKMKERIIQVQGQNKIIKEYI